MAIFLRFQIVLASFSPPTPCFFLFFVVFLASCFFKLECFVLCRRFVKSNIDSLVVWILLCCLFILCSFEFLIFVIPCQETTQKPGTQKKKHAHPQNKMHQEPRQSLLQLARLCSQKVFQNFLGGAKECMSLLKPLQNRGFGQEQTKTIQNGQNLSVNIPSKRKLRSVPSMLLNIIGSDNINL